MAQRIHPSTRRQLVELARAAAQIAYCPYSRFPVGAAVLAGGQMFTGNNIENASYGLTVCAERAAIFRAVVSGQRAIEAIAVTCPNASGDAGGRMPCGACRQVMAEFGEPDTLVIVDGVGEFRLSELLPQPFELGLAPEAPSPSAAGQPRPRLCIDIDNVIAQSDALMRQVIAEVTGGRVELRYEDVVEFDYRQCPDPRGACLQRDEWTQVHDVFSDRVLQVEPYPGIQAILKELSETFELHLATSRLYRARAGTIAWLERHDFPQDLRLHFLRSGEKHLAVGRFFASVEDELAQAVSFAQAGIHSFVLAHPWNAKGQDGLVHRYASWPEIKDALLELAGAKSQKETKWTLAIGS